jgi:hypothetical protein
MQPRFPRQYVIDKELYRGKPSSAYPTSPLPLLENYPSHTETVDYDNVAALSAAVERIRLKYQQTVPLNVEEFTTASFVRRVRAIGDPLLLTKPLK